MINFINNVLLTPYVQAIIFFLLVGLFFLQRRRAATLSLGLGWLRTIILVVLFLYFAWNWASEIPPSLRTASVFGMLAVNLSMLYNLILGSLEEKYRQALEAYAREVNSKAALEKVWSSGRLYLKARFLPEAILSGHSPASFLQGIINHQIPGDLQQTLKNHGVSATVLTHHTLLTYLAQQLDRSSLLPAGLKENIGETLKQFAQHAWLQEQVDNFLHLVLTNPEALTQEAAPPPSGDAKS
jgi:hypothetical protein